MRYVLWAFIKLSFINCLTELSSDHPRGTCLLWTRGCLFLQDARKKIGSIKLGLTKEVIHIGELQTNHHNRTGWEEEAMDRLHTERHPGV